MTATPANEWNAATMICAGCDSVGASVCECPPECEGCGVPLPDAPTGAEVRCEECAVEVRS